MNREQFLKKIDSYHDEFIHLRRHIHAHPELSGFENQTAILISGYLKNIGWNVTESVGRTGVIADFGPLDNLLDQKPGLSNLAKSIGLGSAFTGSSKTFLFFSPLSGGLMVI